MGMLSCFFPFQLLNFGHRSFMVVEGLAAALVNLCIEGLGVEERDGQIKSFNGCVL